MLSGTARTLSLGLLGQTKKEWSEKHSERHNRGTNSCWSGMDLQGFFFPMWKCFTGKVSSQRGEALREGRARGPEGSQGKTLLTLLGDIWVNSKHCHPMMLPGLGRRPTSKGSERPSSYCTGKSNIFIMTTPVGVWSQAFQVVVLIAWCKPLLKLPVLASRGEGRRSKEHGPWGRGSGALPVPGARERGKAVKEGSTRGGGEERCSSAACNDCHGAKNIARAFEQPLQGNVSHFHWWGRPARELGE